MTTVGSLTRDLAPGNEVPGKSAINLPPSPTNSVPYIIATSADDDKTEKPANAPINGGSPVRFLQACSKLDMEPNPFEQSFAGTGSHKGHSGALHASGGHNNNGGGGGPGAGGGGAGSGSGLGLMGSSTNGNSESAVETPKPILPPIESMSGRLAPVADQYGWDAQSLRMGPLSPSMLQGPQNPIVFDGSATTSTVTKQSPLSLIPFSTSTQSLNNIFPSTSNGSLQDNGPPFVAVHGPARPIPPSSQQQHPPPPPPPPPPQQQQHHLSGPPGGRGPPQNYAHQNGHPPVNDGYMSQQQQQGPPQHHDSMNGYGNLHLLSQATHREMLTKREGAGPNNGPVNGQQHAHHHAHGAAPPPPPPSSMGPQGRLGAGPGGHASGPHYQNGQNQPGMAGMTTGASAATTAGSQMGKNGPDPGFARGVRRPRFESEDNSDDSDQSKHSGDGTGNNNGNSKKKQNTGTGEEKGDDEEKRKNFLERNRQAALKCRQRKKQWLANLQQKVEYLTTDNEHLQGQVTGLRDEIIHLKALLLAHKDCPVAQANGVYGDSIGVPGHGHAMMDRSGPGGYPMPPQQQQGRGGPRGPMPPQHAPPPPHHHGPMPGGPGPRMGHPPPPVPSSAGAGRPMAMMQDITPNASPSQGQANVRY